MADLVRRLKTELTRSPKKTAILAFGTVVAAVFWGRMLWKPSEDVDPTVEARPASAQIVAPVVPSVPLSKSLLSGGNAGLSSTSSSEPSWGDLLVWMKSSVEAESAGAGGDIARDPFDASDPTLAVVSLTEEPEAEASGETQSGEEAAPAPEPGREAAQAMTLQGVLKIGSQRFVRLDGQTLAMGESFEVPGATDADGQPETWVVLEIESDGVAIRPSTGGEPVRLNLSKTSLSGVRTSVPERE
jgi:hypothetical protein